MNRYSDSNLLDKRCYRYKKLHILRKNNRKTIPPTLLKLMKNCKLFKQ